MIAGIAPFQVAYGVAVLFAIGATVAVGWMLLTRPSLLRGLLSGMEGQITAGRIQLLIAAPVAAFTAQATSHKYAGIALLAASNLGYLGLKLRPVYAQFFGRDS